MDIPLKLVEIVIVVVAGVAFYVWQMRQLKADRARTAAESEAARQQADQPAQDDDDRGRTA